MKNEREGEKGEEKAKKKEKKRKKKERNNKGINKCLEILISHIWEIKTTIVSLNKEREGGFDSHIDYYYYYFYYFFMVVVHYSFASKLIR